MDHATTSNDGLAEKRSEHVAVLLREAIDGLAPKPGGAYVDATLGGATHTGALLDACAPDGRVLSLDVDPHALRRAAVTLERFGGRWKGRDTNFRHLADIVREEGMEPVDGVLFDLGLSSDELSDPSKGLSFLVDGPLDMRLGPNANEDGLTAADIVNTWSPRDLETLIRNFGEERFARRIADGIVNARKAARIIGTLDLVSIIRSSVPRDYEHGRIHPATRTFQALRIVVNDEMEALREALAGAVSVLAPGGRLAVISFHSLEDRIVKQFIKSSEDLEERTKKPLVATDREQEENPRSRSAKLRIAEKKI